MSTPSQAALDAARLRHARAAASLCALVLVGCTARPPERAASEPTPAPPTAAASASADAPPVPPPAGHPVTVIAAPTVLRTLEGRGFDIGTLAFGGVTTEASVLAGRAGYRDVIETLKGDLAADRRRDRNAGVGMRFGHRQLDARWLTAPAFHYELVGVVNRLDRRPFTPGLCGEVRFVHRLAYGSPSGAGFASRVPLTVNVVFLQGADRDGGCREAAARWLATEGTPPDTAWATADSGPLGATARAGWTPKSVEIDAQTVRWPSTVRPNMAGHAEYTLRVFHRKDGDRYDEAPLENTIDAERLRKDSRLRAELLTWLSQPESLTAIDEGTVVVPERFLVRRGLSVTPHGLARLRNRVFASTFAPEDFAGVDLAGRSTFSTPPSLLRRLDSLSCPGCHQSRSIAGFHLLGAEPEDDTTDALVMGMSPHFHDELGRRARYTEALAAGAVPDEYRPPAERPPTDDGHGAHCGLGDPGLASWTCRAGLECRAVSDREVGLCLPPGDAAPGDPCEPGQITASFDAHRDRMRLGARGRCAGERVCEASSVGFPGGMCAGSCDALPDGAVCGRIAILDPFNRCIAAGTPFDQCLQTSTRPGALARCDFHTPCRDDMVCTRTAEGGACLPPYFMLQLRVDGHVPGDAADAL